MLGTGKQFLPFIRHPPCYSYSQQQKLQISNVLLTDLFITFIFQFQDIHVMISYNWGNQRMVKRIAKYLRDHGITVWIDVDNLQGSIVEAMANAIEQADIFLMCYSQKYKYSNNCRAGI
jgi:hypothetical protein